VQPGAIVGALAHEGGLSRGDFGHIDIHGDHTLVELPADLPDQTFQALERTRVSGQLIHLTRDDGPPPRRRATSSEPSYGPGKAVGKFKKSRHG
jgi:ATP-dependent RNA helicase DeaD